MKTLTVEQVVQLHVLVLMQTGGGDGLRDLGRLESVIAAQAQVVFGEELYKGLFEKAATLCRGIIADHPFFDGNERTAMLAALTFLQINGQKFVAAEGELEDFTVEVAVEHLDIAATAAWLKAHTKKLV
jgi:death on curing protein